MTAFTTVGAVRGGCGHQHKSIERALDCIDKDDRACKRAIGNDGYSDRIVMQGNGDMLTDHQFDELLHVEQRRFYAMR